MKILALYGARRAGKSEAAKTVASIPGWARMSFADPLYDMLSVLLKANSRSLDKEAPMPELCGKTIRQALMWLGTEWGRDMLGHMVWLNALDRSLSHARNVLGLDGVVIDDLRFANEYAFLRERGAHIIRINRAGLMPKTLYSHASENDWADFIPDQVVENSGSVEDWQERWKYHLSSETEPCDY